MTHFSPHALNGIPASPRVGGDKSASSSGTPSRRPSMTAASSLPYGSSPEAVVEALTQALKHSGSIVTQNLRMRALQVPESLLGAYSATAKADMLMPQFDAKVDVDNLLEKLPLAFLKQ